MSAAGDHAFEVVGPREYLDRLQIEYHLSEEDLQGRIRTRAGASSVSGKVDRQEYLVHDSVLRSHGAFPCAGDNEALDFCAEVADEMVRGFGISRSEAVARINRQWSEPEDPAGRVPRIWIFGDSLIYHCEPAEWATGIYYGFEGRWWDLGADRQPLPPP